MINVSVKQTAKHIIIVLRKPIVFSIHPEKKLPVNPPAANIITVKPRCCCASTAERLCTHVGAHEKMAHKPISIAPNITEPLNKLLLYSA